mgnify:CR=1 FL=1
MPYGQLSAEGTAGHVPAARNGKMLEGLCHCCLLEVVRVIIAYLREFAAEKWGVAQNAETVSRKHALQNHSVRFKINIQHDNAKIKTQSRLVVRAQ